MILAIDVGNSSTIIGLYTESGILRFCASLKTGHDYSRDQWAVNLQSVFRLYDAEIREVTGTILSSVVPPISQILKAAIELLCGQSPILVGTGIKTGLNILAESHGQLGADIVALSVGAVQKYPSPLIVIEMGTATSLSVLKGHTYLGCVIMPGLYIGAESLARKTAELPQISIEVPQSILGRSTVEAMRAGVVYGHAAMLDAMIERLEEASEPAQSVIITGEGADVMLSHCKRTLIYDDHLLMDGLYYLYQKNARRRPR